MGKTGSWFSAIKRVFAPNSREKFGHGTNKRASKERNKWGIGKLKPGETNSFIPLYREPSSIEKILGDAERENQTLLDLPTRDHQRTPSFSSRDPQSHRSLPSKVEEKPFVTPPNVYQPKPANKPANYSPGPKPNLHLVLAAIRIQTAYRGYSARRSYRALKGLMRLQGVMRGQSVKRQTMKAMKCMQQVVRVQSQIHSRRVQMMESQAQQRQTLQKSDNDQDSNLGKWCPTPHSEKDDQDQEWDDSVLTKEEREARLQRKVGAVIKRERQLAYAYSHQLWKATPKTAHAALMEIRSGGQPWLWNWVERHVPTPTPADAPGRTPTKVHTPSRTPTYQRTPKQVLVTLESGTPKSLRSSPAPRSRPLKNIIGSKVSRTEVSARTPLRDDESLTSCPPFSEPNYMAPTESAKAKARAQSNLNERSTSTPSGKTKKRMTFALGQSIGSIRWSKGMSFFSGSDSGSKLKGGTPEAIHSIGNVSVDSTVSLPAAVGSKPFRFK
ncbi:protein IQ-DOMAIN 13-like [Aristolochia californica]|uniref:protein IQ-DOMAIN 13-like n=1 Tax=Aristolochia californica TaxID=171875 RepID=UPI0035DF0D8D